MVKFNMPNRQILVKEEDGLKLYKARLCFNLTDEVSFRLTVSTGKERSYIGRLAILEKGQVIRDFIANLDIAEEIKSEFRKLIDRIIGKV